MKYTDQGLALLMNYGPELLLALITLVAGLWIIKLVVKGAGRALERKDIDPSLQSFVTSFSRIMLKAFLFISVVSMIGIQVTSVIAILEAAGLAVGMALSGTLQNFAGRVMILIFKPFKIGDVIEAQGFTGSASEIRIFNTIRMCCGVSSRPTAGYSMIPNHSSRYRNSRTAP